MFLCFYCFLRDTHHAAAMRWNILFNKPILLTSETLWHGFFLQAQGTPQVAALPELPKAPFVRAVVFGILKRTSDADILRSDDYIEVPVSQSLADLIDPNCVVFHAGKWKWPANNPDDFLYCLVPSGRC